MLPSVNEIAYHETKSNYKKMTIQELIDIISRRTIVTDYKPFYYNISRIYSTDEESEFDEYFTIHEKLSIPESEFKSYNVLHHLIEKCLIYNNLFLLKMIKSVYSSGRDTPDDKEILQSAAQLADPMTFYLIFTEMFLQGTKTFNKTPTITVEELKKLAHNGHIIRIIEHFRPIAVNGVFSEDFVGYGNLEELAEDGNKQQLKNRKLLNNLKNKFQFII